MKLLAALLLAVALVSPADAAEPCAGRSLIPEIMRDRPDVWRQAQADFAATPNGTGLFWKIEKEGVAPSWLLGTMHVTDVTLSDAAASAFAAARTVVLESTEVLDPGNRTELAAELVATTKLPEGESFDA